MKKIESWHPIMMLMTLFLMNVSCVGNNIEREIGRFVSSVVDIPSNKMIELHCSLYTDSAYASSIIIVDYIDMESCSGCVAAQVAALERSAWAYNKCDSVGVLHVISMQTGDITPVYGDLCHERVRGKVYIDTCNAFLSANPQFPSSPLLRTFVMDRKGTVLLVGNPFNGDRMKSMLDKIVDNKRRQHAASVGMIGID